jgi:hypothetical protein
MAMLTFKIESYTADTITLFCSLCKGPVPLDYEWEEGCEQEPPYDTPTILGIAATCFQEHVEAFHPQAEVKTKGKRDGNKRSISNEVHNHMPPLRTSDS